MMIELNKGNKTDKGEVDDKILFTLIILILIVVLVAVLIASSRGIIEVLYLKKLLG